MKKLLLLALLLGLPSSLFAGAGGGYKMKESCKSDANEYYYSLWKKKTNNDGFEKGKVFRSEEEGGTDKMVYENQYDEAEAEYDKYCEYGYE